MDWGKFEWAKELPDININYDTNIIWEIRECDQKIADLKKQIEDLKKERKKAEKRFLARLRKDWTEEEIAIAKLDFETALKIASGEIE